MEVVGLPVVQAATQGFQSGFAEALSSETGDYTNENSTVVVRTNILCCMVPYVCTIHPSSFFLNC